MCILILKMAISTTSIIVIVIAIALLGILFVRSRNKKAREEQAALLQQPQPGQVYDSNIDQNVGGILDGNTLLQENLNTVDTNAAPNQEDLTGTFQPITATTQVPEQTPPLGKDWNWPLVIIIILIAIFIIWLIGYALAGTGRSGAPIVSTSEPLFTFLKRSSTGTKSGTRTSSIRTTTGIKPSTATRTSTMAPAPVIFTSTGTRTTTVPPPIVTGPSLQVIGAAEIEVFPTEIQIFVHLSTTAPSDLEAQESLNGTLSDLRGALRSLGIPESDILNSTMKVQPAYSTSVLDLLSRTNLDTNTLSHAPSIQLPIPPVSQPYPKKQKCDNDDADFNNIGYGMMIPPKPTLSIRPTATIASIDVMIRTPINPLMITPLIDTVAFKARQFSVIFTISASEFSSRRESAIVAARQNATDTGFIQAQAQSQQLGATISEQAITDKDIELIPITVSTPRQIQLLLNGTSQDRVKIRAHIQKTFALLPKDTTTITTNISTGTSTTIPAFLTPLNNLGGTIQYA
jgi:hypothetical protein